MPQSYRLLILFTLLLLLRPERADAAPGLLLSNPPGHLLVTSSFWPAIFLLGVGLKAVALRWYLRLRGKRALGLAFAASAVSFIVSFFFSQDFELWWGVIHDVAFQPFFGVQELVSAIGLLTNLVVSSLLCASIETGMLAFVFRYTVGLSGFFMLLGLNLVAIGSVPYLSLVL